MPVPRAQQADLVLVDQTLTPSQERNLEKLTGRRVLDRNGLILDIFAQRARSFEGKLQVELAQLSHLATRLVRGWTHLERQKGGIGLRGPGETQLETDRRLIAKRIRTLKVALGEAGPAARHRPPRAARGAGAHRRAGGLYQRRQIHAVQRARPGPPPIVADQLFATLDPTVRRVKLAGVGEVVLADTVGFVRALPHELVAAFRSTLQEARDADLLLHVVDASDPQRDERIDQVREVLRGIGAGEIRELVVFNKIDLSRRKTAQSSQGSRRGGRAGVRPLRVTGAGLAGACARRWRVPCVPIRYGARCTCELQAAAVRSDLYRRNAVRAERQCEDGSWDLDVELDLTEVAKLLGAKGVNPGGHSATRPANSAWLERSLVGGGSAVRMRLFT